MILEGCKGLSEDIERAIDVGMHHFPSILPVFVHEPVTVVSRSGACGSMGGTSGGLRLLGFILDSELFVLDEARLARVTLLDLNDGDAVRLGLVADELDQCGVRDLAKVLVRLSPERHLLLPALVASDHDDVDPALDHRAHNAARELVQKVLRPALLYGTFDFGGAKAWSLTHSPD